MVCIRCQMAPLLHDIVYPNIQVLTYLEQYMAVLTYNCIFTGLYFQQGHFTEHQAVTIDADNNNVDILQVIIPLLMTT